VQLTALDGANAELQAALAAEQARAELALRELEGRGEEAARLSDELAESRAQTEKAIEQVGFLLVAVQLHTAASAVRHATSSCHPNHPPPNPPLNTATSNTPLPNPKHPPQVCSANMATEQAEAASHHDRARLEEALRQLAAAAGVSAERDRLAGVAAQYALLKQRYVQKSALLKEAQARVHAKEEENAELMRMCDELLAQQEAARCAAAAAAAGKE